MSLKTAMFLTMLLTATGVSLGGSPVSDGGGAPAPATESPQANVIVPHDDPELPKVKRAVPDTQESAAPGDNEIELTDVAVVVGVPESLQDRMIPKEKQLDDVVNDGVDEKTGQFRQHVAGKTTMVHTCKDDKCVLQAVDEASQGDGKSGTRPVLVVTAWVNKNAVRGRYGLAIKEVKSGENAIEKGMELRGGIKAIADGVKPDTYDVYLEIELPKEHEKTILVRGTFSRDDIPAVRAAIKKSGEGKS